MKICRRNFQGLLTTPSATNPEILFKNLYRLSTNRILSNGTFFEPPATLDVCCLTLE